MAQGLVVLGADPAGVMQAGRWKTQAMSSRFAKHLLAGRSAAATFHRKHEKGACGLDFWRIGAGVPHGLQNRLGASCEGPDGSTPSLFRQIGCGFSWIAGQPGRSLSTVKIRGIKVSP